VPEDLPKKIEEQIKNAGLPQGGAVPFQPKLTKNPKGDPIIEKAVKHGPKKGKKGYVDLQGRVWIRDRAHGGDPDHWCDSPGLSDTGGAEDYAAIAGA